MYLRYLSGGPISVAISLSLSTKHAGPWRVSVFLNVPYSAAENTASISTCKDALCDACVMRAGSLKRLWEKLILALPRPRNKCNTRWGCRPRVALFLSFFVLQPEMRTECAAPHFPP